MREAFENGHNKQLVDLMTYRAYQDLFKQWKSAKKEEKSERLKEMILFSFFAYAIWSKPVAATCTELKQAIVERRPSPS